jgi:hypothetical protein
MFIGVIIGTYSSIFVASASLLYIRPKKKPGEDKELSEYEAIEKRQRDGQSLPAPEEAVLEGFDAAEEAPEEVEARPERGTAPTSRKRSGSSRNPRRRRRRR